MSNTSEKRADHTATVAETGASLALERFRGTLSVDTKASRTDLVTETDRRVQEAVVAAIADRYPDEPVVGEEGEAPTALVEDGPCWVVDPIDGTSNYVREFRTFATAVAALVDGEVVGATTVLPALGDTYHVGPGGVERNGRPIAVSDRDDPDVATICPTLWWTRIRPEAPTTGVLERFADVRRLGCAQAELAAVADGSLEAAVAGVPAAPWDTLAGVAMVRAAGGRVTDFEGRRWRHDSAGLVASNGHVHEAILEASGSR